MTATAKYKSSVTSLEALLGQQGELFKRLLKESLQEVLEAEITEAIGAAPSCRLVICWITGIHPVVKFSAFSACAH